MLKSPWLIAHAECLSSRVPTCMLAMYTSASLRHAYCCRNTRTVIVFDDEPSDDELVDGLTSPRSPGMGVCVTSWLHLTATRTSSWTSSTDREWQAARAHIVPVSSPVVLTLSTTHPNTHPRRPPHAASIAFFNPKSLNYETHREGFARRRDYGQTAGLIHLSFGSENWSSTCSCFRVPVIQLVILPLRIRRR
jgi:hypothetical protein